jgi:transmembrane sensor
MMSSFSSIEEFLNDDTFRSWVLEGKKTEKWEKILSQPGENRDILLQAREILLALDREGQDWPSKRQDNLLRQIQKRTAALPKSSKGKILVRKYLVLLIPIVCLVGMAWWYGIDDFFKTSSTVYVEQAHWVSKSNPKGQKSKIHLPDGSTVFLNAESNIRFRQDFGKLGRELYMQGEAFFEVAENEAFPFQVFCESLSITALGTSFNINSFQEGVTKVQLATGKVIVENETYEEVPLELAPGEEVVFTSNTGMEKRAFDFASSLAWKNGTLFFQNTDLETFTKELERWYGVEITVMNPPKTRQRINGEFTDDYLSKVLEAIGYAYGFSYEINQKQVVITFN